MKIQRIRDSPVRDPWFLVGWVKSERTHDRSDQTWEVWLNVDDDRVWLNLARWCRRATDDPGNPMRRHADSWKGLIGSVNDSDESQQAADRADQDSNRGVEFFRTISTKGDGCWARYETLSGHGRVLLRPPRWTSTPPFVVHAPDRATER